MMATYLDWVSLAVSVVGLLVSVLISIVSLGVSLYVASYLQRKYGDVAGVLLDWELQKNATKRARVAALQSLINEVVRIREVANHYRSPDFDTASGAPKLPMTAFETAFVSGSPGLVADEGLVKAVSEYLVRANSSNWLIDKHRTGGDIGLWASKQDWTRLSGILDRLDECLKRELEA